jgi:hypothetical protein
MAQTIAENNAFTGLVVIRAQKRLMLTPSHIDNPIQHVQK